MSNAQKWSQTTKTEAVNRRRLIKGNCVNARDNSSKRMSTITIKQSTFLRLKIHPIKNKKQTNR